MSSPTMTNIDLSVAHRAITLLLAIQVRGHLESHPSLLTEGILTDREVSDPGHAYPRDGLHGNYVPSITPGQASNDELWTAIEVATYLRCSLSSVYNRTNLGRLPGFKFPGSSSWRYRAADIRALAPKARG